MREAGTTPSLLGWGLAFALSLVMSTMLISGCGYSLEFSKLEDQKEEEDPITLIRRNIRQIKADHRVALFDLRKEQTERINQLQTEMRKVGALRQNISQLNLKLQETQVSLSRRNADIDERISEMEGHHRLIQGSIEEEANRFKEVSEQASSFALRELEGLKKDFFNQKKWFVSVQKESKSQLSALRTQIDSMIKNLSEQLSQVIEKVVPAVNDLGRRADALERQLKNLGDDIDMDALNRRMSDLTDALDIQRQSLEMLGNTLTSRVDEQRVLLRQTIDRLKTIELTPASNSQ